MSKHDHAAIQQSFVAHTDERTEARTVTQRWLQTPENVDELLDAVASGQSVRRFCEGKGISYSPTQRFLTSEDMASRYVAAQEQQAEHLLGEMERVTQEIESGEIDPKAGAVIMDSLKWRITRFNARRYSDRQVVEQHLFDHTKAHTEALRQLARAPRALIEGQVIRHALPAAGVTSPIAAPLDPIESIGHVGVSVPCDTVQSPQDDDDE